MTNKSNITTASLITTILLIVTAGMGAFDYAVLTGTAWLALVGILVLLISPIGKSIFANYTNPLLVAILGFILWNGISMFYAEVPKTAMFEFSKLITATFILLLLLAFTKPNKQSFNLISGCLSLNIAIFGFISIDAASDGPFAAVFKGIMSFFTDSMQYFGVFENGVRITGIFGNANTYAGLVALGVFLSLTLAINAESKNQRLLALSCLAINAMTYVLLFSMGSIGVFVVASLAMLIFSDKEHRITTLILMVEALITTLLFTVIALTTLGESEYLPLACIILNVVSLCALDTFMRKTIVEKVAAHTKASLVVLVALVVLVFGYIVAGLNVTGPLTIAKDETIMRAIYPESGQYSLTATLDVGSNVNVRIITQNMDNLKIHNDTLLYYGPITEAVFEVPEDSEIIKMYMTGASDVNIIQELKYFPTSDASKSEEIKLDYTLLPSIAANRIQDLGANQNTIQRIVFFEDGLKLFKQSPIIGNGLGSFETEVGSVQDFYYITRYAHNHYVQSLCDLGVIGLCLFIAILALSVVTLLKLMKRSKKEEYKSTTFAIPLMVACLIMIFGQAITDLTWSAGPYLVTAFAVFAQLLVLNDKNFDQGEVVETKGKKAPKVTEKSFSTKTGLRLVAIGLSVFMLASVSITVYAYSKMSTGTCTPDDIIKLVKLDRYGADDYKTSFIKAVNTSNLPEYYEQCDIYAAELVDNPDAVLDYLIPYYFNTGQEENVYKAAKLAIEQDRTSTEMWNRLFEMMRTAIAPDRDNPVPIIKHLLDTDNTVLADLLDCYYNLQARNQDYLDEAMLDDANIAFVGKLLGIENFTMEQLPYAIQIFSNTIFDSTHAVDANGDALPDNIKVNSGSATFADGAIETTDNTVIVLNAYCVNGGEYTLRLSDVTKADGTALARNIKANINGEPLTVQYEGNDVIIKVNLTGAEAAKETDSSLDKIAIGFPNATKAAKISLTKQL